MSTKEKGHFPDIITNAIFRYDILLIL